MTRAFTESVVEEVALRWLEAIGWRIAHGQDIAPDTLLAERRDYGEVVLPQRLRDALARPNPDLPAEALEDAFRKITRPEGADLIQRNRALHRLVVNGVTVEYRTREGEVRGAQARVIDFDQPGNNDWLAVNQFSVTENKHSRRPDVVLFVNGLPLAVIELKNAADENATVWTAFQQLQTYKAALASGPASRPARERSATSPRQGRIQPASANSAVQITSIAMMSMSRSPAARRRTSCSRC